MAQTGQAAKAVKKKADALPKVSTKKLLKDAAVNAVMLVGPGKFLKAGKIAGEGAKVARVAIKKIGKDAELKAATSAAEVIKKEKYLKQTMARPVVRNKDIKKRSTQDLTPNEKRYEKLGEKASVTVTKKEPMSFTEIRKARAIARKAKFDKVLTPRPKPKPNRKPLKPIDNSRGSNAPVKPKLNDEQQILENAKANPKNWDIADQRRPSNIAEGRGNTLQPPSVTKNPIERGSAAQKKEARIEKRKARQADRRDRRADIAGSKRTDYKKPRVIQYTTGPKSAKPGTTKRIKIGDQTVSRTNDPRNAASDAGNMREKLKAIDKLTATRAKNRSNKVSPELKAKVEATLNSGKAARKSRQLQNTFNKPKFSRNVTTGRLSATRPIKPVKK